MATSVQSNDVTPAPSALASAPGIGTPEYEAAREKLVDDLKAATINQRETFEENLAANIALLLKPEVMEALIISDNPSSDDWKRESVVSIIRMYCESDLSDDKCWTAIDTGYHYIPADKLDTPDKQIAQSKKLEDTLLEIGNLVQFKKALELLDNKKLEDFLSFVREKPFLFRMQPNLTNSYLAAGGDPKALLRLVNNKNFKKRDLVYSYPRNSETLKETRNQIKKDIEETYSKEASVVITPGSPPVKRHVPKSVKVTAGTMAALVALGAAVWWFGFGRDQNENNNSAGPGASPAAASRTPAQTLRAYLAKTHEPIVQGRAFSGVTSDPNFSPDSATPVVQAALAKIPVAHRAEILRLAHMYLDAARQRWETNDNSSKVWRFLKGDPITGTVEKIIATKIGAYTNKTTNPFGCSPNDPKNPLNEENELLAGIVGAIASADNQKVFLARATANTNTGNIKTNASDLIETVGTGFTHERGYLMPHDTLQLIGQLKNSPECREVRTGQDHVIQIDMASSKVMSDNTGKKLSTVILTSKSATADVLTENALMAIVKFTLIQLQQNPQQPVNIRTANDAQGDAEFTAIWKALAQAKVKPTQLGEATWNRAQSLRLLPLVLAPRRAVGAPAGPGF